jgi:membrane-associated phospholipid phosphatase
MNRSLIANFFILLLSVTFFSYWYIDQALALYIDQSSLNTSNYLFKRITQIGDSSYAITGSLLLFIIYRKRNKRFARQNLYILSAVVASGLIVDMIKVIAGRMRPELLIENHLYGFTGVKFESAFYSFPSGHSATAFAFFMALTFMNPKYKVYFLIAAFLVAVSRIVLMQHYLSDVLIGSAIGSFTAYWIYYAYYLQANTIKTFAFVTLKRNMIKSLR